MSEHREIYLEAVRNEGDDRMWCQDDVFDDSSRYVLAIPIETENKRLHQEVAMYITAAASHADLVRELDEIINGDNAALQASLCDIVAQVKQLYVRLVTDEPSEDKEENNGENTGR